MSEKLQQLIGLAYAKTSSLIAKTVGMLIVFLLPIKPIMLGIGFFVLIDLFTGLWKARKLKEEITSRRIRSTVSKLISYQVAIILCYILEKIFIPEAPAVKIIASLIAMTELVSVNENLFVVTGLDVFKTVVEKINLFKSKQEIEKKE